MFRLMTMNQNSEVDDCKGRITFSSLMLKPTFKKLRLNKCWPDTVELQPSETFSPFQFLTKGD